MTNLESSGSLDKNKRPLLKEGNENSDTRDIEVRREYAEHTIDDLLVFLADKIGKQVNIDDLPTMFGESGINVKQYFQEVMTGRSRYERMVSQAQLIKACDILKQQVDLTH